MRLLKNKRTGVILPWNQYLETHPDMVDYEEPKAEEPKPKAKAKPKPKPKAKAKPVETPPDTEIEDLLAGLDST